MSLESEATVFYDEACRLCQGSVAFIRKRDKHQRFGFEPLQTARGQQVAAQVGLDPEQPGSLVLELEGQYYVRSDGALRIARLLRQPWPVLVIFRIVPRVLRDAVYDWIARNRYRWFGRHTAA